MNHINHSQRYLEGKVNEMFEIHFAENPTTGYSWAVTYIPDNVCLFESYYETDSIDSQIVGSGGTRIMRFGGVRKGTGELKLMYVRPWELANPFDSMVIHVFIQ